MMLLKSGCKAGCMHTITLKKHIHNNPGSNKVCQLFSYIICCMPFSNLWGTFFLRGNKWLAYNICLKCSYSTPGVSTVRFSETNKKVTPSISNDFSCCFDQKLIYGKKICISFLGTQGTDCFLILWGSFSNYFPWFN